MADAHRPQAAQTPSLWLARAPHGEPLPDAAEALDLRPSPGARDAAAPGAAPVATGDEPVATLPAPPRVDVAVIGGGLCGTVAAWLLLEAGQSVALIEARRVGEQATGLGSGAVSALHAPGSRRLVDAFGEDTMARHVEAHRAAVDTVERLCRELALDCGFERVPAFAWAQRAETAAGMRDDEALLRRLGLAAEWLPRVDGFPFPGHGALRLDGQARIDPLRFVRGLAARFAERGGHVLERTRVLDVDEDADRAVLRTERGTLVAGQAILATGLPFVRMGAWYAEAYPRAQVLAAVRLGAGGASLPEGLWQTADDPSREFHVLREPDGPLAIVTSRAFKTGEVDARAPRVEIDGWLRDAAPAGRVLHAWSTEHWESMDGLPFVGHLVRDARRLWVATGLGPQAATAVAAALVLAERVRGREHRGAAAWDAGRVNAGISARRFLSENLDVAKKWIHDHLASSAPLASADALAPGEAALVAGDGGKIAAYRDPQGALHAVDATCTHMGCTVGWNAVSTCWDCPCHGSRFSIDGQVLHGPATEALAAPRWSAAARAGAEVPDAYRRAVDPEAALFDTPDAANMRPGHVPEAAPSAMFRSGDRGDSYRRAVDPEAATFDTPDAADLRPESVPEAAPAASSGRRAKDKPSAG